MRKVTIGNKTYTLRCDMSVLEIVEENFESVQNAFAMMQNGKVIKPLAVMFAAMVNAYNEYVGDGYRVTYDDVKRLSPSAIKRIQTAVNDAFADGMNVEKDDEEVNDEDAYLTEYEKQKH